MRCEPECNMYYVSRQHKALSPLFSSRRSVLQGDRNVVSSLGCAFLVHAAAIRAGCPGTHLYQAERLAAACAAHAGRLRLRAVGQARPDRQHDAYALAWRHSQRESHKSADKLFSSDSSAAHLWASATRRPSSRAEHIHPYTARLLGQARGTIDKYALKCSRALCSVGLHAGVAGSLRRVAAALGHLWARPPRAIVHTTYLVLLYSRP